MRNPERIREERTYTMDGRRARRLFGLALLLALAMFIAGFFVGKEWSVWVEKVQVAVDNREGLDQQEARMARMEEEFVRNYERELPTRAKSAMTDDPKLQALIQGASGEKKAIEAMPPKPAGEHVVAEAARDDIPQSDFAKALYTLQLTAGRDEDTAARTVSAMRARGYETAYLSKSVKEGITFFRVRVGRFATEEQMKVFADFYQKKEGQRLYPATLTAEE
jgi:cell division septation protein DedD